MSDPKRWLDEGPPEAIEHLIRAAEAERPSEQSLSRALAVLGAGVGASGAAATAAAATAGAAASGAATTPGVATTAGAASLHGAAGGALGVAAVGKASGVLVTSGLVKWGVVVTALAAAGVAGKVVVSRAVSTGADRALSTALVSGATVAPQRAKADVKARASVANVSGASSDGSVVGATSAPSVSVSDVAAPSAVSAESAPAFVAKTEQKTSRPVASSSHTLAEALSVATPSSAVSSPSVATFPSLEVPPADTEHLAEEVALVDRARGALANGDAAGALTALNQYDAQFTRRKFAPEALYLRMEALLREGRTSAARAVAQTLAQSFPTSPHAARARQVLGQTIP